jgi:hypothetical protein
MDWTPLIEAGVSALVILLPVVIAILSYYLKGYLQELKKRVEGEVGKERLDQVLELTELLIRAAEQLTGLETDEAKKDYVTKELTELVADLGLPLTPEQIDAIIEGVYQGLKNPYRTNEPSKLLTKA